MSSAAFKVELCHTEVLWPRLAEMIRSSCSQLYSLGNNEGENLLPHHSNEIISDVRRRLGKVPGFSPTAAEIRAVFIALVKLEDLAHVGRSKYLPREVRVIALTPHFVRMAGGIPLDFCQVSGVDINAVSSETIGRVFAINAAYPAIAEDWAIGPSFEWGLQSVEERATSLSQMAGNQAPSLREGITFYNPWMKGAVYRGRRWQRTEVAGEFSIARTDLRGPNAYFLIQRGRNSKSVTWFDVSYEHAQLWLVVLDQIAGVTHSVGVEAEEGGFALTLPINVPKFCHDVFASAANHIQQDGYLRRFQFPSQMRSLIESMCEIAALKIHE